LATPRSSTKNKNKNKKFVGSKLDAHLACLSGACNNVQPSVAAGLSASSGDVLEQQAGVKFLGKRLGATRDGEATFFIVQDFRKSDVSDKGAYQSCRTQVIVLWYITLLLGKWKGESRMSKAEIFFFFSFRTKLDLANFFGNSYKPRRNIRDPMKTHSKIRCNGDKRRSPGRDPS
jgi:hypothetical protein